MKALPFVIVCLIAALAFTAESNGWADVPWFAWIILFTLAVFGAIEGFDTKE